MSMKTTGFSPDCIRRPASELGAARHAASLLASSLAYGAPRAPNYHAAMDPGEAPVEPGTGSFIQSLMETDLYSIGAYFCDQHPELVDEVVERSEAIESRGLESWAAQTETPIEEGVRTLLTGLAVRYYKAVAG
jgi:hypothetical protein